MHIAIAFVSLWLLAAASQASAQPYPGVGAGPKLGELEIKAYQKIPKTKVAVQLTSDNHLARELRRQVMIRLAQRGNEVGFSGGNVMLVMALYAGSIPAVITVDAAMLGFAPLSMTVSVPFLF